MARTAHDTTRKHVAAAVDAETEDDDTLFAARLRFARIALILLQMPDKSGFP